MKFWRGILVAGATLFLCSVPLAASARGFSALHAFAGSTDGSRPFAPLLQDAAGNLYGTTGDGGGTGCGGNGCGTVFRIAPDGTETILYAFQGGPDGEEPLAGLIADASGNLYGTTTTGGNPDCLYSAKHLGCGTVFELSPGGTKTILYTFAGGKDGSQPWASLAMDQAGDLFGTTAEGGGDGNTGRKRCGSSAGCGTVFEIAADGTESVLHAFRGGQDGDFPYGNVVLDNAGELYGATSEGGGGTACSYGCGTVYKILAGGEERVLYRFQGGGDGSYPGSLIIDGDGDLFGMASDGGGAYHGTIFRLTPRGHIKVLHVFQGGSDGAQPSLAPLTVDAAGNLYGTTLAGGDGGFGTVFKLAKNDKETVLHAFATGAEGSNPYGGVIANPAGDLFGTTYSGGDADCPGTGGHGCGIVFELKN
jgi:uncharacterized repeat protein (TIGR03803 family)